MEDRESALPRSKQGQSYRGLVLLHNGQAIRRPLQLVCQLEILRMDQIFFMSRRGGGMKFSPKTRE